MELTLQNIDATIAELQKRRQQTAEMQAHQRQLEVQRSLPTEHDILTRLASRHGDPIEVNDGGASCVLYRDGAIARKLGYADSPWREEAPPAGHYERVVARMNWLRAWCRYLADDARQLYTAATGGRRGPYRWTGVLARRYGVAKPPMSSQYMVDGLAVMRGFQGCAAKLREALAEINADASFDWSIGPADIAGMRQGHLGKLRLDIETALSAVEAYPTK